MNRRLSQCHSSLEMLYPPLGKAVEQRSRAVGYFLSFPSKGESRWQAHLHKMHDSIPTSPLKDRNQYCGLNLYLQHIQHDHLYVMSKGIQSQATPLRVRLLGAETRQNALTKLALYTCKTRKWSRFHIVRPPSGHAAKFLHTWQQNSKSVPCKIRLYLSSELFLEHYTVYRAIFSSRIT